MVLNAEEDELLTDYAMERSKNLIKNYIISIGRLNNKNYKVVFK